MGSLILGLPTEQIQDRIVRTNLVIPVVLPESLPDVVPVRLRLLVVPVRIIAAYLLN